MFSIKKERRDSHEHHFYLMFTIEGIPFVGMISIPREVGMVCKVRKIKSSASAKYLSDQAAMANSR